MGKKNTVGTWHKNLIAALEPRIMYDGAAVASAADVAADHADAADAIHAEKVATDDHAAKAEALADALGLQPEKDSDTTGPSAQDVVSGLLAPIERSAEALVSNDGTIDPSTYTMTVNVANVDDAPAIDLVFDPENWDGSALYDQFAKPGDFVVGDVDGDGDEDVFHITGKTLYKNDGEGNFSRSTLYTTYGANNPVMDGVMGDVDGDGDNDVLYIWKDAKAIYWNKNVGNGLFAKATTLTGVSISPSRSLDLADMDGDGDLDILVGAEKGDVYTDTYSYWLENNGVGGFSSHEIVGPNHSFAALDIGHGDLDNDGHVDIILAFGDVSYYSGNYSPMRWLKNNGDGSFQEMNEAPVNLIGSNIEKGIQNFSVSDMDNDGDLDIVATHNTQDTVYFFENDGSGNFATNVVGTGHDSVLGISVADMDGDGDKDIVATSNLDSVAVRWYENDGTGTFATHVVANVFAGRDQVALADFDGDGKAEFVLNDYTNSRLIKYSHTLKAPSFIVPESSTTAGTVSATDVDGDTITFSLSGTDADLFNIDANTGEITFKTAPDYENPADSDSDNVYNVIVTATANGKSDSKSVSITVTDANELPTSANNTVIASLDTVYTFESVDFAYADENNDSFAGVTISTLPAKGTLLLDGNAVNVGDLVTASDIYAKKLKFVPANGETGADYTSFTFRVNDGQDDSVAYTMKVAVTAALADGDNDGFLEIHNLADWIEFTNDEGAGKWATNVYSDANIELMANIDLGGSGFAFDTDFTGNFQGNDFTLANGVFSGSGYFTTMSGADSWIKNLNITSSTVTGVNNTPIGILANTVTSASIDDVHVGGTVHANGAWNIGGLLGGGSGSISNSSSSATIDAAGNHTYVGGLVGSYSGSVSGSHATGDVTGDDAVGGLIGSASNIEITNSYATGNVTTQGSISKGQFVGGLVGRLDSGTISGSYATGDVSGAQYVGGLVGVTNLDSTASAVIQDSFAIGDVTGSNYVGGLVGDSRSAAVTSSFSTGSVSATGHSVGGLVGTTLSGNISQSYATGDVSGADYVGGLAGKIQGGSIYQSFATGVVTTSAVGGGLVASASSSYDLYGNENYPEISGTYAWNSMIILTDGSGLVGRTGGTSNGSVHSWIGMQLVDANGNAVSSQYEGYHGTMIASSGMQGDSVYTSDNYSPWNKDGTKWSFADDRMPFLAVAELVAVTCPYSGISSTLNTITTGTSTVTVGSGYHTSIVEQGVFYRNIDAQDHGYNYLGTQAVALAPGDAQASYDGQTITGLESGVTYIVGTYAKDAEGNYFYSDANYVSTKVANALPTSADNTVTTTEDTAYTFAAGDFKFADTDEGDSLESVTIVTLPAGGTLELDGAAVTAGDIIKVADIEADKLTFTPAADASGDGYASFTFKVTDKQDASAAAYTMTIDVTSENDPVIFGGDTSKTIVEDSGETTGTLTATDVDNTITDWSLQTQAENGTASVDDIGNWAYTPDADFFGTDTFVVRVTDSTGATTDQTVTISVSNVDDPAVITGDTSGSGDEDTTISGDLNATDADGTISWSVTTQATNGTASINSDGTWSYVPTENWSGTDTFTVTTTDPANGTSTQVVNVTVNAVDDAPSIAASSLNVVEGVTSVGTVTATDVEGDAITYSLSGADADIFTIDANTGEINFKAAPDFENPGDADSDNIYDVTVTATANGKSTDATYTITVTNKDEAGAITGDTAGKGNEDTDITGDLNATDGDGTPTFSVTTNGQHGTAAIDSTTGEWTYSPDANWSGSDTFTVTVTDPQGGKTTQVVTVTVDPVNDGPSLSGTKEVTINEDGDTKNIATEVEWLDVEGESVTLGVLKDVSNGTLDFKDSGSWSYTPDADFFGTDTFTIRGTDASGAYTDMVVTITVKGLEDEAVFTGDTSGTATEDNDVTGTLTATDVDGSVSYSIKTQGQHGSAEIDENGNWTFTPTADWSGSDSFVVLSTDEQGGTTEQTIAVTITPAEDEAVFSGDVAKTVAEDGKASGTVAVTDADGAVTKLELAQQAQSGFASIKADGSWDYMPNADFNGTDTFIIRSTDETGETTEQVITVTVTAVDDAAIISGTISATANANSTAQGSLTATDVDGTIAGWSIVANGDKGEAAIDETGNWTYTPATDWSGTDTFVVRVTDSEGGTTDQVIIVTVNAANAEAEITGNVAVSINEDTSAQGQLTVTGVDGSKWTVLTDPAQGSAQVDANGAWTYTPAANWSGEATFTIRVTDNDNNIYDQVVTVTVRPVDDATSYTGDTTASGKEDTAASGTLSASDVDGAIASWAIEQNAANGVASIDENGNWTYTPVENWSGSDSFLVTTTDELGGVSTQVVTVTMAPADDAAVFSGNTSATTNVETAVSGSLAASDEDGDITGWSVSTDAQNGTAQVDANGNWTYTPAANWSGTDTFTIQTTDSEGGTSEQVVTITVNDADSKIKIVGSSETTTNEDSSASGTLSVPDEFKSPNPFGEGYAPVGWSVSSDPVHGEVSIDSDGNWTYTPAANWSGTDTFVVGAQMSIVAGDNAQQTITVTVLPVDDASVISGDTTGSVAEDSKTSGIVSATDVDGAVVDWSIAQSGEFGTATIDENGVWTYTPDANQNGTDTFTVISMDAKGGTTEHVITVNVAGVDDNAVFSGNTSASGFEDTAISGQLKATDPDGAIVKWSIAAQGNNGTAYIDQTGAWVFKPAEGWFGDDTFVVQTTDVNGDTSEQVVTIKVISADDEAMITGQTSAKIIEDTQATGDLDASDADGKITGWAISSKPANGAATVDANGNWEYTPEANWFGKDSFTIQTTDENGDTSEQVINIIVVSQDDEASITGDVSATIDEDTTATGNLSATDGDGPFSWTIGTQAENGHAKVDENGAWTYTPDTNWFGTETFTIVTKDVNGDTTEQKITVTVNSVDDEAVFTGNASSTVNEDTVAKGTLVAADADGDVSWAVTAQGTHGTASIDENGNWTFTPAKDWSGKDSFTITTTDVNGDTSEKVVNVTILPQNDPAIITGNLDATVFEDTKASGQLHGSDVDGDIVGWKVQIDGAHGTASVDENGAWTYIPDANWFGTDEFTIRTTDANGGTSDQIISVTILSVDDEAVFSGDKIGTGAEDTSVSGDLNATDVDGAISWAVTTDGTHGTATVDENGGWTYTPDAGWFGTDSFMIATTDVNGDTSEKLVSITMTSVDDPATFTGDTSGPGKEDSAVSGALAITDADGKITTIAVTTQAQHGTAYVDADGNWVYTPADNFFGSDSFTITTTDIDGGTTEQVITLTVDSVDDEAVFSGDTTAKGPLDTTLEGTLSATDADGSFAWSISSKPANGSASIDANGTWNYTPDTGWSGTETFTVLTTDANGDTSEQVVSVTIKADVAPTLPGGKPGGPGEGGTPTPDPTPVIVGASIDADSTVTIYDAEGNVAGTTQADENGDWAWTPATDLQPGVHVFAAYGVKAGENIFLGNITFTVLDTETPGTPTQPTLPGGEPGEEPGSFDPTPPIGGSNVDGDSTVIIYDSNGDVAGTTQADANGAWSWVPENDLNPGVHVFSAFGVKGGEEIYLGDITFTVMDSTLPGAPSQPGLPGGEPGEGGETSDPTPTIGGGNVDTDSTITIYNGNGDVAGTTQADENGQWTWAPTTELAPGTYVFSAYGVEDGAKVYLGDITITVRDTSGGTTPTAPGLPGGKPGGQPGEGGTETPDPTPSIGGTNVDTDSTVTIYNATGDVVGTTQADENGKWEWAPTTELAPGTYVFSAYGVNSGGNIYLGDITITVLDPSDPETPTQPALPGGKPGGGAGEPGEEPGTYDPTPTLGGTNVDGDSTVTIYDANGDVAGTTVTDAEGNWNWAPTTDLAPGKHVFSAFGVNNGASIYLGEITITVLDNTVAGTPTQPGLPGGKPGEGGETPDQTPTIGGSDVDGEIEVTIYNGKGEVAGTTTADADGKWTWTPSAELAPGTHVFTAIGQKGGDKVNLGSITITVLDSSSGETPTAPTIPGGKPGGEPGAGETPTYDPTPTFGGTNVDGDSTVTIHDADGTVAGTTLADENGKWDWTPTTDLDPGVYVFSAYGLRNNEKIYLGTITITILDASGGEIPSQPGLPGGKPGEGGETTDPTPTIGGSNADGETEVTVYNSKGEVVGTSTADAAGNWNWTPATKLTPGEHVFTAIGVKNGGKVNFGSITITVLDFSTGDTPTAPTVLGGTPGGEPGEGGINTPDPTPTIGGSNVDDGSTITIYNSKGEVAGTTTADAQGKWDWTPSSELAPGTYIFSAYGVKNGADVYIGDITITVLDTTTAGTPTQPSLPGGQPGETGTTFDPTPTVHGGAVDGASTVIIYDAEGNVAGTIQADAEGNWTWSPSSDLAPGTYVFSAFGEKDGKTVSLGEISFTIKDATADGAPSKPGLPGGQPGEPGTTSDPTPTVTGGGVDPETDIVIHGPDGEPVGTGTSDDNGDWEVTITKPLTPGTHVLTGTGTKDGTPVGLGDVVITVLDPDDTGTPTQPCVPGGEPGEPVTTGSLRPSVIGAGLDPNTEVEIFNTQGTKIGTTTTDDEGKWEWKPEQDLDPGKHIFTCTGTEGGKPISAGSLEITVLEPGTTGAPAAPQGPSGETSTYDTTPTMSGTGKPGSTIKLYDEAGTLLGTGTVDSDGKWNVTVTDDTALTTGNHTLNYTITDPDTGTTTVSPGTELTILEADQTNPFTLGMDGADGSSVVTYDSTPTLSGTATPGAVIHFHDADGNLYGSVTVGSDGKWTFTTAALSVGDHVVTGVMTLPNGEKVASSDSLTITVKDGSTPDSPTEPDFGIGDGTTSDTTPTFEGTGVDAGTTVYIYDSNGDLYGTTTADENGKWTFTPTTELAPGTHLFTAKGTRDNQTIVLGTITMNILDPNDPATPTEGDVPGDVTVLYDSTPTLTGKGTTGSTVEIYDGNNTLVGATTIDANGNWTFTVPDEAAFSPGEITLKPLVINPAGEEILLPVITLTIRDSNDPDAPTAPEITDAEAADEGTPTLTGTNVDPNSPVEIYDMFGTLLAQTTADSAGSWSVTIDPALDPGDYVIIAKVQKDGVPVIAGEYNLSVSNLPTYIPDLDNDNGLDTTVLDGGTGGPGDGADSGLGDVGNLGGDFAGDANAGLGGETGAGFGDGAAGGLGGDAGGFGGDAGGFGGEAGGVGADGGVGVGGNDAGSEGPAAEAADGGASGEATGDVGAEAGESGEPGEASDSAEAGNAEGATGADRAGGEQKVYSENVRVNEQGEVQFTEHNGDQVSQEGLYVSSVDYANNEVVIQVADAETISGGEVTFTATMADGASLPAWLSIDAQAGVITARPPEGVDSVTIQVTSVSADGDVKVLELTIDLKAKQAQSVEQDATAKAAPVGIRPFSAQIAQVANEGEVYGDRLAQALAL